LTPAPNWRETQKKKSEKAENFITLTSIWIRKTKSVTKGEELEQLTTDIKLG